MNDITATIESADEYLTFALGEEEYGVETSFEPLVYHQARWVEVGSDPARSATGWPLPTPREAGRADPRCRG